MEQKLNGFEETQVKRVSGKKIKITKVFTANEDVINFKLQYIIKKIKPNKGEEDIHPASGIIPLRQSVNIMQVAKSQVEIAESNSIAIPSDCNLFLHLTPTIPSIKSITGDIIVIYQFA